MTRIRVLLSITGTPTGNQTWEIQGVQPDGSPDGTVISTGTLDMATVTADNLWKTITMSGGTLTAGTQYALVGKDGFLSAGNLLLWGHDETAPSYAGGSQWISTDTGATWGNNAGDDHMFQIEGGTYNGTLCTLADAVNKAGTNASAAATEEILVSDYVRQAEGLINSVTRFDWINAYSGLTDQVKFLLNRTASALAVIDIITYDMSAYTASTAEAETMLNVYREEAEQGLDLLRDQDVKKFIVGDS